MSWLAVPFGHQKQDGMPQHVFALAVAFCFPPEAGQKMAK